MAVVVPSIGATGQTEVFEDGDRITCTVGATPVVGGRLVELSADRTVIPAAAASRKVLGVAMFDGAVGAKVTVATDGVWMLLAQGAIAAGDQVNVSAGADGRVATVAAAGAAYVQAEANAARSIVGMALAAIADAATGPVLLKL